MKYSHYNMLAELFDFPGPEYYIRAQELMKFISVSYPDAAFELEHFLEGIPNDFLNMQELYSRTFDVQAITTLDTGYVMFGDDYKRAMLLSNLTKESIIAGLEFKGQLADHLPNMLRLIPKLKDQEVLGELVSEIMVPALMLMIREFGTERIEKKNTNYLAHYKILIDSAPGADATIYCRALESVLLVLKTDFEVTGMISRLENLSSRSQTADFLGQIVKEMEIEESANPTNSGCDS